MAQHPRVTLDVTLADRVVDLVEEGFDMAVRIARLPKEPACSLDLLNLRSEFDTPGTRAVVAKQMRVLCVRCDAAQLGAQHADAK